MGGGVTGTKPAGTLPVIEEIGESNSGSGGSGPVDEFQYTQGIATMYSTLGVANQYYAAAGQVVAVVKNDAQYLANYVSGTPALAVVSEYANDAVAMTNTTTYTADFEILLCNLLNIAACGNGNLNTTPPANVLVRGPTLSLSGTTAAYGTAMQAAVTAVNMAQGTNIKYYPSLSWILQSPTGCPGNSPPHANDLNSVDGEHLCGALSLSEGGQGKIANNEIPIYAGMINGSSYTFTCPGTGTVNKSLVCTFTLPAGTTWTGSLEPMTLTGSGVSSPYSGGVSLPVPSSGTSFTVSVQPWAVGTLTLTPTAGAAAWTDASPRVVTVSAQSPTPSNLIQ